MPAVIAQSSHRIEACYATAIERCNYGIKPIVMAYFLPSGYMVKGHRMLPLGLKTGD